MMIVWIKGRLQRKEGNHLAKVISQFQSHLVPGPKSRFSKIVCTCI